MREISKCYEADVKESVYEDYYWLGETVFFVVVVGASVCFLKTFCKQFSFLI